MATSTVLGLYLPDGSDYVSVDRDLNQNYQKIDDAFSALFVMTKYSTSNASLSSNSSRGFKGSDLGVVALEDYVPVAFIEAWASSTAIAVIRTDITKVFDADNPCITIRNVGSSSSSAGTFEVSILWVKADFVNDQTST